MELRPEDIPEIMRIFAESEMEELHLDIGGTRLDLSKRGGQAFAPVASAPASASAAPTEPAPRSTLGSGPTSGSVPAPAGGDTAADPAPAPVEDGLVELRSPLLGVFYRRPAPDKPAFVEPGSVVGADDPVCIVDVMKMFTRVPAGVAGTIVEIVAEDGKLVEHGQVLMRLRPA